MGASCAPALFETFSTFLEWVVRMQSGADSICHYADDFLFIGGKNRVGKSCKELLECFQDVCRELGVPLAEDKTIEPTTCQTFLGLKIDSAKQMVSVPDTSGHLRKNLSCTQYPQDLIEITSIPHWLTLFHMPGCGARSGIFAPSNRFNERG